MPPIKIPLELPIPSTKAATLTCGALLALALSACSTVSPQAVTLSEVVSQRVHAMQVSHEAFVRGYFGQSRERIEDFLVERWIPEYLGRFVADATGDGEDLLHVLRSVTPFDDEELERLTAAFQEHGIDDSGAALAAASEALSGGEQGEAVLEFAQVAMGQIELKRRTLLGPIDDLERQTLQQLQAAYSQIQQAQGSVTAHLRSLADVQDEQNQLLARLRILEKRDEALERAITVNERVTGVLEAGEGVVDTLTALEQALHQAAVREAADSGDTP
jgi:hypothetical protein